MKWNRATLRLLSHVNAAAITCPFPPAAKMQNQKIREQTVEIREQIKKGAEGISNS
jgi:hypothetical protein